jgi:hypothetical protein
MKNNLLIFLLFAQVAMASTCKKDYYTGTENVRLKATLNNSNESIHLGDTLKVTLSIPNTFVSESSQSINVNSLQQGLYTFVFYQLDTITKNVTRIRTTNNISVSKGSIDNYLASVYVSTSNTPYESILNIIPTSKGVYYLQITGSGSVKVNNAYEAFLKVNFNVTDIHNAMMSYYISPEFGNSMLTSQNDGIGIYAFRVN